MVALAVRKETRAVRTWVCPPKFATTHRVCERWNVSVGTGLPADDLRWQEQSLPPPLDDDTAMIVDQIILKSPPKTKRIIVKLYRTGLPDTVIAQQVGLTPETLITGWHLSLNYLQWRFIESRHPTLLAILRFRE